MSDHLLYVQVKVSGEETERTIFVARFEVTLHQLHECLKVKGPLVCFSLKYILDRMHEAELVPVAHCVQVTHLLLLSIPELDVHLV